MHSVKKSRTVREVHIHYCAHPLAELSELKTRPNLWRKVSAASSSAKHASPLHQQQTRLAAKQLQACLGCLPACFVVLACQAKGLSGRTDKTGENAPSECHLQRLAAPCNIIMCQGGTRHTSEVIGINTAVDLPDVVILLAATGHPTKSRTCSCVNAS